MNAFDPRKNKKIQETIRSVEGIYLKLRIKFIRCQSARANQNKAQTREQSLSDR